MKILAIETTEPLGSVAAMCDGQIVRHSDLDPQQRSAQSLAPGIRALLAEVGWQPRDIDLVAVTVGPGSFTGLRVGVTTAKTLAYCAGAQTLGINTLEVIAAAAPVHVRRLTVAIDAQRGEVVVQSFHRDDGAKFFTPDSQSDGGREAISPQQKLIDIDRWLYELAAGTILSGPILNKLLPRLPQDVAALPSECWRAQAANVARLAAHHHALGTRHDLWKLVPVYSRISAAEEKWRNKTAIETREH